MKCVNRILISKTALCTSCCMLLFFGTALCFRVDPAAGSVRVETDAVAVLFA